MGRRTFYKYFVDLNPETKSTGMQEGPGTYDMRQVGVCTERCRDNITDGMDEHRVSMR